MSEHSRDALKKRLEVIGYETVLNVIKKYSKIYDEISLETILNKAASGSPQYKESIRIYVEDLIVEGKLNARIRDNIIVFQDIVEDTLVSMDGKLDSIKEDTELFREYVSTIEEILEKVDDVEFFLKTKLASDFEKIKYAWEYYKEGRISRRELIYHGLKVIGKQLVKKII